MPIEHVATAAARRRPDAGVGADATRHRLHRPLAHDPPRPRPAPRRTGDACLERHCLLDCLLLHVASLPPWVVVLGLGPGGNFSVALLCIALRARDSAQADRLSAMSRRVGYCLAAIGPLGVGMLRDATGGWIAVAMLFAVLAVGAGGAAWQACRDRLLQWWVAVALATDHAN
jgi:hypothetical protein